MPTVRQLIPYRVRRLTSRRLVLADSTRPGAPTPANTNGLLKDERGEVSSAVILTPIVMLIFMLCVQGALVFHARTLVQTAAQDAARATQVETGTIADGQAAASQWVTEGGLLRGVDVTITRGATQVNVTVSSGVQSLVPFWDPTVTATVEGPVEVFRPEGERT